MALWSQNGKASAMWSCFLPNMILSMVDTGKHNKRNEEIVKPEIIMNYKEAKQGIDISDQMACYFTSLGKTIRCFHKIGFEFLLNTTVVNALIIFQEIRGKIQIAKFRYDLIYLLAEMVLPTRTSSSQAQNGTSACTRSVLQTRRSVSQTHRLEKYTEKDNKNCVKGRRCSSCYSEIKKSDSWENASKKAKKSVNFL